MAKEMSTFSKNNILSQAAQAMLAQANQQPQQVLAIIKIIDKLIKVILRSRGESSGFFFL